MNEIFKQLAGLLVGSVPTVILFVLLYLAYRVLVHKPMLAVLAERRFRTIGAIEKSRADIAAVQQKTAEYEQRLRQARLAIFQTQEQRLAILNQTRETAMAEARTSAESRVKAARAEIEGSVVAAKLTLQANAEALANEIIRGIMKGAPGAANVRG